MHDLRVISDSAKLKVINRGRFGVSYCTRRKKYICSLQKDDVSSSNNMTKKLRTVEDIQLEPARDGVQLYNEGHAYGFDRDTEVSHIT